MATRLLTLTTATGDRRVEIHDDGTVVVDGGPGFPTAIVRDGSMRMGHTPVRTAWTAASGDTRWVFVCGEVYRFEVARAGRRTRTAPLGSLSAPMPATVVRVQVHPGDTVTRGQTLIVLEAMKMELPVHAPADGRVAAVHCKPGDLVQPSTVLINLDETV